MEEYSGYHDDFSEGEGETLNIDEEERGNNHGDDDEQYAQKVNGKMERLQRRIEELEQELSTEKHITRDLKQRNTEITVMANERTPDTDILSLQSELQKYKKKCEQLQEKYEMSLLTGNSSSSSIPAALQLELQQFCEKHRILPELAQRTLSVPDVQSILKAVAPRRPPGGGDTNLYDKIRGLEEELKGANSSTLEDAQQLKNKIFHLSERIRVEKEYKRSAENEVTSCKKKISMLGDHMEKLIIHLKRESAQKLRLAEQLRVTERENLKYKEKCDGLAKKISAKDRLLFELREGSKVLEDQLRLMDEKYLELRGKLDWARAAASKKIRKAEKTATDLRVKFAMTGSSLLLDNVSLPGGYSENGDQGSTGGSWLPQGLQQPSSHGLRGITPLTRGGAAASRLGVSRSGGDSVFSMGSQRSEPTLDGVLEKIRVQQGAKQDWTDDKLKKLVKSR